MAERRMFAKTIIDSDAFLDMPLSSQALYFHLSMRADDDGFINNPKKIQRMIGGSDDDLKLLVLKRFVIPFESGVCVIKHWMIHNYIRSDRYKETVYQEEKRQLTIKGNKAYTLEPNNDALALPDAGMTVGIPNGCQEVDMRETQVRLGKDSIGKVSVGKESIGESENDTPSASGSGAPNLPDYSKTTFSPQMIEAVDMWLQYKKERREAYKPTGLKGLITEIQNNIDRYGEQAVSDLIHKCIAAGYRGIIFDRLHQPQRGNNRQDSGFDTSNPFMEMLNERRGAL